MQDCFEMSHITKLQKRRRHTSSRFLVEVEQIFRLFPQNALLISTSYNW